MLMLAKLAFRLRPPLTSIPSRGYISPIFSQKPLARPYSWWIKARYRPDGTRRSILRGILHGALYVSVVVYAYRQHSQIKHEEVAIRLLSQVVELQRINRKYRGSAFTEPAEIKDFVTEISKFDIMPVTPRIVSTFCENYEPFSKLAPENLKKVQERVCELHKLLAFGPNSGNTIPVIVKEVPEAWHELMLEIIAMNCQGLSKQTDILEGILLERVEK
ncbi:hypothetical protein AGABI2DRAFT_192176 [Agaricus bisporus var. bisporus H97]|uniref:hypothetical protein n=1 Tax=Agaricus bisporus var. bisporus (strain H97 / ATCC MYA-4626 / FGSC 10389) TaxID=936046 RepID=UPI00029F66AA|nr:hypothetical protein AGABI2DRAFT_192176 [Agaricus bisporus var. bisporus H97]EKV48616.1 hypothetical protein AGABI2DRAFT_192176 [Agaricus bisporus var. bisporus H97]